MIKATASGQRAVTMQLLPTVLYCLLLTSLTTSLKRCDDCIKVVDCKPALDLLLRDRRPEAVKQLQNAACDVKGSHKVCCSSLRVLAMRYLIDENENNAQTSEDELENHRNIRLLLSECGDMDGNRIIGGTTAGLYEFPWMALISYNERNNLKFKCGGSVITSRYVLTAGHCINKNIVGVRIGDYDISQPEDCLGEGELRECESKYQDIAVTHRILHPKYVTGSVNLHDIGLLRLATTVDFSYRNSGTICLPITRDLRKSAIPSNYGTVAGWGATGSQQQSNILLKVQVTIYSESTCKSLFKDVFQSRSYNSNMSTSTICAGEKGRDSCKGDSGGPLMVEAIFNGTSKFVQFGIVSYGVESCGTNKPGLYTDVRKYMKWILDTIKP